MQVNKTFLLFYKKIFFCVIPLLGHLNDFNTQYDNIMADLASFIHTVVTHQCDRKGSFRMI